MTLLGFGKPSGDGLLLASVELGDRIAERGIADPVGAVGERRQETTLELVRPLRSSFKKLDAVLDRVLDGLVVAQLKVEAAEFLCAAPVASVPCGN